MKDYLSNYYDALLAELNRRIKEEGLSRKEVGEILGVNQPQASRLLNGKSRLTVEQLLRLAQRLAVKPAQIIAAAEASMTELVTMPPEVEATVYKSEIHLLAYSAATKEITVETFSKQGYPARAIRIALDELYHVGVLAKRGNQYIQKHINRSYNKSDVKRTLQTHHKLATLSADRYLEKISDPAYRAKRFCYLAIDRYTPSQIMQIDALLYSIYEKLSAFNRENMANGYSDSEEFSLWNIHLMLATPLE